MYQKQNFPKFNLVLWSEVIGNAYLDLAVGLVAGPEKKNIIDEVLFYDYFKLTNTCSYQKYKINFLPLLHKKCLNNL